MKPAARWCLAAACAVSCAAALASGAPVQIYPSGPSVPENLLRIELRFAAPLRVPLKLEHLKLSDAEGHEIEGAFLDLPLPSADGTSITLLLHPGRVKSGVGANLKLGRALQAGTSVTLSIDDPAIGAPTTKSWRVGPADVDAPSPASWTLEAPRAGSREPLTVHLNAAISSTSPSLMAVRAPDGARVEGVATLSDFETTWRFVPRHRWRPARYALMVHPELEDPSGNRACASFEMVGASRADCGSEAVAHFIVRAGRL